MPIANNKLTAVDLPVDPGVVLNTSLQSQITPAHIEVQKQVIQLAEKLSDTQQVWDNRRQVGQEIEFVLINSANRPAAKSIEVLSELEQIDENFGSELLQSNIESGTAPLKIGSEMLVTIQADIQTALVKANKVTDKFGARAILTGVLPTYYPEDFVDRQLLYPERYELMNEILFRMRHNRNIVYNFLNNHESFEFDNFSVEGAATSHQVHLSGTPEEMVKIYNSALVAMGPLMAIAANSPVVFAERGWHESRIPLLSQGAAGERFIFSSGFAKDPQDLFLDLLQYESLTYENNGQTHLLGKKKDAACPTEHLPAFQAQNGTVWKWLRPCYTYSPVQGAHIRLEQRILPAGPTAVDMAANAAFYIGVVYGLLQTKCDITKQFDFESLKFNFENAAKSGLSATMLWKNGSVLPVTEVIAELLPLAKIGLASLGVGEEETKFYLGIIKERNFNRQNGAQWILSSLAKLEATGMTRKVALEKIVGEYARNQFGNNGDGNAVPVHQWRVLGD